MQRVKSSQPRRLSPVSALLWRLGGTRLAGRMGSALRPLALASLVANVSLIVTGAAVRLTNSGLGCPTWPKCTQDSYTTTPEMGVHGVIEFGNRMLTWVLVGLAVA